MRSKGHAPCIVTEGKLLLWSVTCLYVRAEQWREAGFVFFYFYFFCAFPGLFNVALGMLAEKLALLMVISIEVSERAFSLAAVLAEGSFWA